MIRLTLNEEINSALLPTSPPPLPHSCVLCSSVRALGTAAVDMCQVATGGADAYYHIGMHCWDIAASAIIVQEAGGVIVDTDGLYLMGKVVCVICGGVASSNWFLCPQPQSST